MEQEYLRVMHERPMVPFTDEEEKAMDTEVKALASFLPWAEGAIEELDRHMKMAQDQYDTAIKSLADEKAEKKILLKEIEKEMKLRMMS